ncbi:LOW QUALITY PROTEIN: two pore channel protein 1-like [Liolophura sinensis]|uniref:LOW QUALITY PROTEIN: two pore channel protein 1-like n=1 Tax=Liolophura sinensis TaxID=3198878 RepID=UPI0031596939
MARIMESPLLIRNGASRTFSINDPESDIANESGNMGYDIELPSARFSRQESENNRLKLWELNYQEAAIFLQEGENNDKYRTHPASHEALPAYQIAHNKWFYLLDLMAAILILFLAACEKPAVPWLRLDVGIHGSLELFCLLVQSLDIAIKLKWLGWKIFFRHRRTMLKSLTLSIMFVEAIVVLIRQTNHFRVTRALRPLFLLDSYYCRSVRRFARQILQSLPPILDMIVLLLFFMLIFSILGFYLFSPIAKDQYFSTIQDSFVSLFVLLTTANYPDVMMPAFSVNRWYAIFFVVYLSLELYFLMNLLLAVVYDTFTGLEKKKLKQLFFHKRQGCEHAFKLLVRKGCSRISMKHFSGMLKYFSPRKSRRDTYLLFKALNTSKCGAITREEFYNIYDMNSLQWKPKNADTTWSHNFRPPFNRIFKALYRFVTWRWFDYFIYLVIAVNFLWILIETIHISVTSMDVTKYNFSTTYASIVFLCVYGIEVIIKVLGRGPIDYFTSGWDLFDFIVTIVSIVGVLGEVYADSFYYIMVLRPFRLLRLFKLKRRYRDVLGTLFVLLTRLATLAIVIILVFYFFAIIGMELFGSVDLKNCCRNTSVEDFYRYDNESLFEGYYYLNNFDNIFVTGVTLFELTVVNNWFIIMDGYAYHVSKWARLYFMLFYLVMMVVMTIVVAFILDAFIFRIQYRRQMHCEDIEDHMVSRTEVALSPEEMQMCDDITHGWTGQYIDSQTPDTLTPHVFRGERVRSREDFSLQMHSDEVQAWVEEEKKKHLVVRELHAEGLRQRLNTSSSSLELEYDVNTEPTSFSAVPC